MKHAYCLQALQLKALLFPAPCKFSLTAVLSLDSIQLHARYIVEHGARAQDLCIQNHDLRSRWLLNACLLGSAHVHSMVQRSMCFMQQAMPAERS